MLQRRRRVLFWLAAAVLVLLGILLAAYLVVRMLTGGDGQVWPGHGPCNTAPSTPGDRRKHKDQLSIVNFNTEWLFLHGGTGQLKCPPAPGQEGGCLWKTKAEARNHLKQVAQVIAHLDADIYVLNEVEGCSVLSELLAELPRGHGYRFYLVAGEDTALGQHPALLTRLDPVASLRHSKARKNYPLRGSTCAVHEVGLTGAAKHYATRFSAQNSRGVKTEFVMAGLHLLAQPKDQSRCARREAQAAIVREAVEDMRKPGDLVVMAGDFNDHDNQVLGADGDTSITGTLAILRDSVLVNAGAHVPQAQRYSAEHQQDGGPAQRSLIDHVLLSPQWRVRSASFYHGYSVHGRSRVSDHYPFKVVLDV
jgi:endonuclease/exonuclease/phosphatase family metal-dependent hydrolase